MNILGINSLNTVPQTVVANLLTKTQVKTQEAGSSVSFPLSEKKSLENNHVFPAANWGFERPEGKFILSIAGGKLYCAPCTRETQEPQWSGLFASSVEEACALVNSDAAEFCVVNASVDPRYQYAIIFKVDGKPMYRPFDATVHGYRNGGCILSLDVKSFHENSLTYADKYARSVPVTV